MISSHHSSGGRERAGWREGGREGGRERYNSNALKEIPGFLFSCSCSVTVKRENSRITAHLLSTGVLLPVVLSLRKINNVLYFSHGDRVFFAPRTFEQRIVTNNKRVI